MDNSFDELLREGMRYYASNGFTSAEVLADWLRRLEAAMRAVMEPEWRIEEKVREVLGSVFKKQVDQGGVLKRHPGIARYTLERVRPELRDELAKRIAANAALIKLNREQEIDATLRRFTGWASSVPKGGTPLGTTDERKKIKKGFTSLSFRERRVLIDQGHKLQAAVSSIVAVGGGAIAGVWRSHWHQANYDYREEHKERDGILYVVRGNWAMERGLIKLAGHRYSDEITQPGEEVFCRCWYKWIYNLRDLPSDMLTQKGAEELERVRALLRAA